MRPNIGTNPLGTSSTMATKIAPSTILTSAILDSPSQVARYWISTQPRIAPVSVPSPPTRIHMMICAVNTSENTVGLT